MDQHVILQGISYALDKIALSYATLEQINTLMGRVDSERLDTVDAIGFLMRAKPSVSRGYALGTLTEFRNSVAHPSRDSVDGRKLYEAVTVITAWYQERAQYSKIITPIPSDGAIIVALLQSAVRAIILYDELHDSMKGNIKPSVSVSSSPQEEDGDDHDSDDEKVPVSEKDIRIKPQDIEITDTLRNLRETRWREDLKGRKIIVLDGKTAGRKGKFIYWNGNVAKVRFYKDQKPSGIPIDRQVAVLRPTLMWYE